MILILEEVFPHIKLNIENIGLLAVTSLFLYGLSKHLTHLTTSYL